MNRKERLLNIVKEMNNIKENLAVRNYVITPHYHYMTPNFSMCINGMECERSAVFFIKKGSEDVYLLDYGCYNKYQIAEMKEILNKWLEEE